MKNPILTAALALSLLAINYTAAAQSQTRTVAVTESYQGISLAGNQTLYFEIGQAGEPITVIGHPEDLDNLEVFVEKNTLRIKYPDYYRTRGKSVQIYVKNPTLTHASLAGSGRIEVKGSLDRGDKTFSLAGSGKITIPESEGDNIHLSVAGSGKAYIKNITAENVSVSVAGSGGGECSNVSATAVSANVAGSGKFTVSGTADRLDANLAGSGKLNASGLAVREGGVKVAGSGNVECRCGESLTATVHGSGRVYYHGRPERVRFSGKTRSIVQR
ncbi:MAG: DUF2807 domain-containing protein [Rikenellaceae bacterium]|nr:DUF2807 domain-containing protein [Rikenellaceae bacterium]